MVTYKFPNFYMIVIKLNSIKRCKQMSETEEKEKSSEIEPIEDKPLKLPDSI